MVCNNTDGVRDLLNGREKSEKPYRSRLSDFSDSVSDYLSDTTLNNSQKIIGTQRVTISMKKTAFMKMAKVQNYKKKKVVRLEPGVWQNEISERLWNATKLKCGFNFKNHYLSSDLSTGSAKGMYSFDRITVNVFTYFTCGLLFVANKLLIFRDKTKG